MIRFKLSFFTLLAAASLCAQSPKEISLKKIVEGEYNEKIMPQLLPHNGESYTRISDDKSMVIAVSYKTGKPVDTLFNAQKARECPFRDIEGYAIGPNGNHLLVWRNTQPLYGKAFSAEYYDFDVRRNFVSPLSDAGGQLRTPIFSPDGRMCAYIKENNIWLRKFDFNTESPVTKDGKTDSLLNGCSDWLYDNAFGATQMMAWSGDSKLLSFVKLDLSEVGTLEYQDYGSSAYPQWQQLKYPLAGTPITKATVHAYSVDTRDIKELKIPGGDYVPMLCAASNPEQVAVMAFNRAQNVLQLYYLNPKSGVARLILREESEAYIDPSVLYSIRFLADGFTFMSDRDGHSHLYLYSPTGTLIRRLTTGNWDVTALLDIDPATKTVYYESTEESSVCRTVYRTDAKGNKTKLSTQKGTNLAEFSVDFRYFVNYYSTLNTPTVVSVCDANGKEVREIDNNQRLQEALAAIHAPQKELLSLTNTEGDEMNAWLLKPAGFSSSKKYPVVVWQQPEPNTQFVLDRYGFGWEYFLASKGYLVLSVDPRGTGGKGMAFAKSNYRKLGSPEADDLQEVARYLQGLSFVDGKHISICGWGYGGFTALMAMSRNKNRYNAAIAIAPITDWTLYNAAFAERYLLTPGENPSGYANSSPSHLAGKTEGALYLIHPTLDQPVHPQNSFRYAQALEEANKFCYLTPFTGKDHEIEGAQAQWNLYQGILRFLQTNE